jgi:hypothetical protein
MPAFIKDKTAQSMEDAKNAGMIKWASLMLVLSYA